MKDKDRLEHFLDDLEVVWMHYRRQSYTLLAAGLVVGFLLRWIF